MGASIDELFGAFIIPSSYSLLIFIESEFYFIRDDGGAFRIYHDDI